MNIWVIASHYDDEVLGCGGVMARFASNDNAIFVSFLTDSSSYQYGSQDEIGRRKHFVATQNCKTFGGYPILHNFPDMKLEEVGQAELSSALEDDRIHMDEINLVLTHSPHDLNLDHRIAYEATLVACRKMSPVTILSYEVLSSSEVYPKFCPNVFLT